MFKMIDFITFAHSTVNIFKQQVNIDYDNKWGWQERLLFVLHNLIVSLYLPNQMSLRLNFDENVTENVSMHI